MPPLSVTYRAILEATLPKAIADIGGDSERVRDLVDFCRARGSSVCAVTPTPSEDLRTLEQATSSPLTLRLERGLAAIPAMGATDCVILDEDFNWYTVYHSLMALQHHTQDGDSTFPVIIVTNAGWPYGRRDAYLRLEEIPLDHQQATSPGGLIPDEGHPQPNTGLHPNRTHAHYEGLPRDGVLTAVEDFVRQSPIPLKTFLLPESGGACVIVSAARLKKSSVLSKTLQSLSLDPDRFGIVDATIARLSWQLSQVTGERDRFLSDLVKERMRLAQECEQHAQSLQVLRRESDAHKSNEDVLQASTALLRKELANEQERAHTLAQERDSIREEAEAQQWRAEALKLECDDARCAHDRITQKSRKREEDLLHAYDALRSSRIEQLNLFVSHFHSVHALLVQREKQLKVLWPRVQHAEAELKRMHLSLSWRWTAPIRHLTPKLRLLSPFTLARLFVYEFLLELRNAWIEVGQPFPGLVRFIRHRMLWFIPIRNAQTDTATSQPKIDDDTIYLPSLPPLFHEEATAQNELIPSSVNHEYEIRSSLTAIVFCDQADALLITLRDISSQSLPPEQITICTKSLENSVMDAIRSFSPPPRLLCGTWKSRKDILRPLVLVERKPWLLVCTAGMRFESDQLRKALSVLTLDSTIDAVLLPTNATVTDMAAALEGSQPLLLRRESAVGLLSMRSRPLL
ncbi:MAG: hypothetical protein PHH13_04570 [Candidatus Peribacteraceae bacterium]|nr:hypothetical protein [Candidatus Peribacteraceae bacterium]